MKIKVRYYITEILAKTNNFLLLENTNKVRTLEIIKVRYSNVSILKLHLTKNLIIV